MFLLRPRCLLPFRPMSDEQRLEQEDRELIQRMASNDAEALGKFYERYNRLAFGLVMRIVGNRADAEDVLVDVFWQVWQQSNRYDSSRGKPVAWLLTIARTRAIDCARSSSRYQTTDDLVEAQSGPVATFRREDSFVIADTRNVVRRVLDGLSEQQKIPLEMAYFQE